jgi:hypothetical protein
MRMKASRRALENLIHLGFDNTEPVDKWGTSGAFSVGCSQCQALVINGVATHEHGCPNAMHECKGCDALIPMRREYCEDCI